MYLCIPLYNIYIYIGKHSFRNGVLAKNGKTESRKHKQTSAVPKRSNGETAKRETENGRNGRDDHPKLRSTSRLLTSGASFEVLFHPLALADTDCQA